MRNPGFLSLCVRMESLLLFLEVDEKSMCYNSTKERRVCIGDKNLCSEITQSVE